jgi:hypothetical protein
LSEQEGTPSLRRCQRTYITTMVTSVIDAIQKVKLGAELLRREAGLE